LNGKDGIDPDGAHEVTIENCCVLAKDDAIVVKTRTPRVTSERVTVRHCTVASDASALKVGTETRARIKNVLFEDCAVFDSDRGLVIYARDGGAIEDVTWRDIRISLVHWPHETGGSPFIFDIAKRDGLSVIKNCRVENVETNQIVPSQLKGLNQAPLEGLAFNNIQIHAESPPAPRAGQNRKQKPPLFLMSGRVTVAIEGLSVDWQGHEGAWAGITAPAGR
jgi:polygalacturonase